MTGNGREARPPTRGGRGARTGRRLPEDVHRSFGPIDPETTADAAPGADEGDAGAAAGGRETRFVSWQDLERVADEAADIDAIVRSELAAVGEPEAREQLAARPRRAPKRRGPSASRIVAIAAISVAAVTVAAFLTTRTAHQQPRARATSAVSSTPSAVATQTPTGSPTLVTPNGIVARLSFSAPCWVNAVADGRNVLVGTLTDGARTIRAKRSLLLTLGNAGGVDLVVNGSRITTGSTGQVVHLSYSFKGGELVQQPG
jgi:uncharacterized protein DUF4115